MTDETDTKDNSNSLPEKDEENVAEEGTSEDKDITDEEEEGTSEDKDITDEELNFIMGPNWRSRFPIDLDITNKIIEESYEEELQFLGVPSSRIQKRREVVFCGLPSSRINISFSHVSNWNTFLGTDQDDSHLVVSNSNTSLDTDQDDRLERRLRDFRFAQTRRRRAYGKSRPWGIIGLYEHLNALRYDLEWADDAEWRRDNNEPCFTWKNFDQIFDKGLNRPFVTYIIIIVCTITLISSFGENNWNYEPFSSNPTFGPSAETLVVMGAKKTWLIVNRDQWWRLITPMFLHAGLIHYAVNMAVLWFIGHAMEIAHGSLRLIILFVIPAVGGNILSSIFLPVPISVGASGGMFGLMGAFISDIIMNWKLLFSDETNVLYDSTAWMKFSIVLVFVLDIGLQVTLGFTPLIDNFAHLGGMIYGFFLGFAVLPPMRREFFEHEAKVVLQKQFYICYFGLIMTVILLVISIVVLAVSSDGVTSPCARCRYFSCIPFPTWLPAEERWWNCG